MRYVLSLLGPFEIQAVSQAGALPSLERKTRAILAYLAATHKRHTRRALSDLFCQSANDPTGSLRWHLSRIRRQVDEVILDITPQDVAFNPAVAATDLAAFEKVLAEPGRQPAATLSQAIDRYRGPFLEDLALPDAPEFELWLLGERTRVQQLYEEGMLLLISRHIQQQDYAAAMPRAQQLVQANALLETAHTQLIWLYAQIGQRDSALQQFERCQKLLRQELAVEPSVEMQAIVAAVLEKRSLPPMVTEKAPVPPILFSPPAETDFVGRTAELQRLQEAWHAIQDTGRTTVLVEAVAGGGKSRLVREFFANIASGDRPLQGYCYESTQAIPYQPWLTLLEARIQQLKPTELQRLNPAWQAQLARLLPQTFPARAGAPEQQEHLFRAAADLLLGPGQYPCILLIEDLQWADEASLQLFLFLGRYVHQAHRPALLIGTFRSEEADDNPALRTFLHDVPRDEEVLRLTLSPLSAGEITALIDRLWPGLPGDARRNELGARLGAETGGNPLFIYEIVRELAQTGDWSTPSPIPPSLQDLTRYRLNQLPASSRQVLETLAVLDRPVYFDLARQISGRAEDEIVAAIERGLRWRFLEPHPATSYDFSHDVIRSAVRNQMSDIRRQRLHHRAAVVLAERGADAATLAYHWGLAGDREQQVQYAILAGNEALSRAALGDAIQLFQQALAVLPTAELEQRYQATLGTVKARDALSVVDQAADSLARLAELAEQTGNPAHRAETALYQARLDLLQGKAEAVKTVARQGFDWAVSVQNRSLEAGLLEALGGAYQAQGDYEQAQSHARQALDLYEQEGDRSGQVSVLRLLGNVARNQGRHQQAVQIHRQALDLCRQIADPLNESRILARLADSLWYVGDYDAALIFVEEGLVVSREIGDKRAEAIQMNNLAGLAMAKEDSRTAIDHYRKALTIVESLGDLQGMAIYQNNIGGAYVGLGEVDLALEFLATAISTAQRAGLPRAQAQAHHTRGRAYQLARDFATARVEFEQALSLRQELRQAFQTLLTLIQLVHTCTELADLAAAAIYFQAAQVQYAASQEQIPHYAHQMYHYVAHLYYMAREDVPAAAEHLRQAHQALQARLAELDASGRDQLAQSDDSRLIFAAMTRLGL